MNAAINRIVVTFAVMGSTAAVILVGYFGNQLPFTPF